ncbi:hypothetical protein SNOG_15663 [Parastagonospora nodorum SN15]|uniref:Secreted protein n=1 Tax=Phaeosphaeria nodorum (strain SN15 / ATCC MYA-4574 / FGSC 10173) TaxID=321614 RepID=Q0TY28_PHANO|nr:hypothetical protein SNOG_15663 [Parastagonospora nodorum SN15]EAT77038.1 hypothetical protein SNOG_15663 [Parastagonospora nodorum SN15]
MPSTVRPHVVLTVAALFVLHVARLGESTGQNFSHQLHCTTLAEYDRKKNVFIMANPKADGTFRHSAA